MNLRRLEASESLWWYALAGALLIGGPVWRYLYVQHYPFDHFEAVALPSAAALIGALVAVGGGSIGGVGGSLIFGSLLFLFADLQFDLETTISLKILLLASVVLAHLLRTRRAILVCLTLTAFNVASLRRSRPDPVLVQQVPSPRGADSLPILVHLVLDEQWGIGGLAAAGDTATASFLTNFYLQRGFEVYSGAYSRWSRTLTALAETISLGRPVAIDPIPPDAKHPNPDRFSLDGNPYLEALAKRGYSIHVYQTSHLDFCGRARVPVASCKTSLGNSVATISYLGGGWIVRAKTAARHFLSATSRVYSRLMPPRNVEAWRRALIGGSLAELEEVEQDLAKQPGGAAFLAHVLAPHRPLGVDKDCRPYADPAKRIGFDLPTPLSDSSWRAVLAQYGGQIRCIHLALDKLLTTLDQLVGRDGAIVLVHGDHGSRLYQNGPGDAPPGHPSTPASQWDEAQLNSSYSTLLAIRRPGIPPRLHPESVPLQDFIWELVRSDFQGEIRTEPTHYVYMRQTNVLPAASDNRRMLTPQQMLWADPAAGFISTPPRSMGRPAGQ